MKYWRVGIAFLLSLAPALPAEARWRVAETRHFRIFTEESDGRVRADAAILEDFHKLLEMLTGRTVAAGAPRLDIYMVPGTAQLRIVRPGLSADVGGFYSATPGQIAALSSRSGQSAEVSRQVLLHEYAHHFMMQVGAATNPDWYVEGFAEYLMTAEFHKEAVEWGGVSKGRYMQLLYGSWVPLEKLLARDKKIDMGAFYAQSWLLTHYLFRVEGMGPKLKAYLARVAEGDDPVESFKAEVDPDLPRFQSRLRAYMNGRNLTYTRMKRTPPEAVEMTITTLPESADQILLPLLSMQFPQQPETDLASLALIRTAAALHPADPWAQRSLAIAEAISGKPEVAAPLLDTALEKSPNDVLLLRWRASLYGADKPGSKPADVSAARRLLVRAFRAEANDWRTLRDYVETFLAEGRDLRQNEKEALYAAYALAPQVGNLAMLAGTMMARDGRHMAAWNALAPTVYDPHGGEPNERIAAFMQALKNDDAAKVKELLATLFPAGAIGDEAGEGN